MMEPKKPFSQACENNKQPIVEVLSDALASYRSVLEIGSGTGQHAVYMAAKLEHLTWQTSDVPENHAGIELWLREVEIPNVYSPLSFTLGLDSWPDGEFDSVYSANTSHIMQPNEVKLMMELVGENLPSGGVFCQYGPFNINGQYTSQSNMLFDQKLRAQGRGGIRDVGELQKWAAMMVLQERISMPANNHMLIWRKL